MIEINDVFYSYPSGVEALKGVSLEIPDGEFIAIMGQNGAGKTTLAKHLNGLLKPSRGSVLIDGVDTKQVSVATLARDVGFVFQNPDHQLFSETVEAEISFALKNFGYTQDKIAERVNWALNLLSLYEYKDVSPFMLSGGERKRVALASVLAWDPQIVILDEPTIGQDHEQKEKLMQFIVQLNRQNKTVVVVTHDIEFVVECAPRIVLMSQGKILACGTARSILTDSKLVEQSSLVLPEITEIFLQLCTLHFPRDVIDLYEAKKIITDKIGALR